MSRPKIGYYKAKKMLSRVILIEIIFFAGIAFLVYLLK